METMPIIKSMLEGKRVSVCITSMNTSKKKKKKKNSVSPWTTIFLDFTSALLRQRMGVIFNTWKICLKTQYHPMKPNPY